MQKKLIKLDRRNGMSVFIDGVWVPLSKAEELDVLVMLNKLN